jgi:hypothetical protein
MGKSHYGEKATVDSGAPSVTFSDSQSTMAGFSPLR